MKDPQAFLQEFQAGFAASVTVDLLGPPNQTGGAGDLPDLSGGSPSVYIRPDRASLADHALVANRIGVLVKDNTAVTYDLSAEETEALSPPAGREAIAYVVTVRVTLHDLTVHVFDGGPLTIFAASTIDLTPTPVPAPVPTPIVTVHTNWVGVKNAAGDFAAADLTVSGESTALTLPTYSGSMRLAFGTPETEADIHQMYFYEAGNRNTHNQIAVFDEQTTRVMKSGVELKLWASVDLIPGAGGFVLEAVQ